MDASPTTRKNTQRYHTPKLLIRYIYLILLSLTLIYDIPHWGEVGSLFPSPIDNNKRTTKTVQIFGYITVGQMKADSIVDNKFCNAFVFSKSFSSIDFHWEVLKFSYYEKVPKLSLNFRLHPDAHSEHICRTWCTVS